MYHDESDKILKIIPGLRRYAEKNKWFGDIALSYDEFKRNLIRLLEDADVTASRNPVQRLMTLFKPFGRDMSDIVDGITLKAVTNKGMPENAIFDILYFQHCWANPLLRHMLVNTFHPFMKARDRLDRDRIREDITEVVERCTESMVKDVIHPLNKHGFTRFDQKERNYLFTYKQAHPYCFLYATYRELDRQGLKIMGVHRLDNIYELDYVKWLMLSRIQLTDVVKELNRQGLAEYSYQIEEQIHLKYTVEELLAKLEENAGGEVG